MRRFLLGLFFGAILASLPLRSASERPPNVILILADDLGYGDLGCYGAKTIATPQLDRMAREGVRFTDAYAAAPFCSPARAALLTGRLPARCGLPYVMFPAEHHGLPADETTLAELLRPRGYATACIGKWHLGWDAPFRPTAQGFDLFYGLPHTNDSREWGVGEPFTQLSLFGPLPFVDGERVIEAPVDQARLTERYTERAVAFIRAHRDQPFFLYLPHTMPHIPQYASPRFAGKSKGGLYGDTVEEIDWSTGVILETLRELKLDTRTLVIFTSDNGAPVRGPNAAAKSAAKEKFPGRTLAGSNAPLRGGKGTTFEGGVRMPFIAWWPGKIAPRGAVTTPVSHLDLLPTLARLAGAALPAGVTLDGVDVSPLLLGTGELPSRPLHYYFGFQAQAVREGNWKLFVLVDTRPEVARRASLWFEHQPNLFNNQHRLLAAPELYDLSSDIAETKNLAMQHPEIVARLTRVVREFDAALQRDQRPMEFVPGAPPPAPGTIRTKEMDLSAYRYP